MTTDPTAVMASGAPADAAPAAEPGAAAPPSTPRHPAWRAVTEIAAPRTRREAGYLVASYLLGAVGFVYVAVLLYAGALLAITVVGLPLIGVAVLGGRLFGRAQRAVAHGLLGESIPAPSAFRGRKGFFPFIGSMLTDTVGWRALAYNVLKTPVVIIGGYAVGVWVATSVVCVTYPVLWAAFDPENVDAEGRVRRSGIQLGEWYADTLPRALLVSIAGMAMLLASPWLIRVLVAFDRALARWLLSRSARDVEVAHLADTRAQAVVGADERLRRIERDLHDGAQARMAAVAMSLGQVQEDLDDPDAPIDRERVRRLVDAAHANSMTAIGELRDLARGIHPPVLDVGLGPALTDLAATSAATVELRLPDDAPRFPADIESIAYFCAAELMANVARHSGARRAVVDLAVVDDDLRLRITDDGHGGAAAAPGSGLSGLADRLAPVDGRLDVRSPLGGPTAVTVEIPLRRAHHG
ncbi:sensor histidine kinase [Iamia sp. SCSIO 61187]|uniref:sensor histidine kinase n=1 Tax=Iamia sp. SCSIO 61187 TaxID=2722752 RepID=UPI001C6278BA|nr:sensor histidine kinase [Iamia sp. SCSIO 61187]QYG93795.1 sensor histidine kinase [Iamia sp. SCSIO 61187]